MDTCSMKVYAYVYEWLDSPIISRNFEHRAEIISDGVVEKAMVENDGTGNQSS